MSTSALRMPALSTWNTADRLAARQHLEGRAVVERDARRGRFRCRALASRSTAVLQHGQRLQAEEVELHQAGRLHPLHVELGDRHVGLRIAVERHQLARAAGRRSRCRRHGSRRGGRGPPASARCSAAVRRPGPRPRAACRRGSPSMAWASVTGLAGFCGTSLVSLSTWP